MKRKSAISEYQSISIHKQIDENDKHKIIQLLLEGALLHITQAILAIESNNIASKGEHISMAITIIDALNSSLNLDAGGELAKNLYQLYQYIMTSLISANIKDDFEKLEEIKVHLLTIKEGWDGIREEAIKLQIEEPNNNLNTAS